MAYINQESLDGLNHLSQQVLNLNQAFSNFSHFIPCLPDNIGGIQMLEVLGTDLTPVQTARQSYNKETATFGEKESKLLKFLLDHKHSSPFRACVVRFKIVCPLYISEQTKKHQIAFSCIDDQNGSNQMSFRYTEALKSYIPSVFRKQDTVNKQGSNGEIRFSVVADVLREKYESSVEASFDAYRVLLETGVSREQARGVLPESTYTTLTCTASLPAVLNFILLRDDPHAQWEIQQYAILLKEMIAVFYPTILLHSGL